MIQAIIETFVEDRRLYLYKDIMQNFEILAKDKQGLCVIKKLIEHTKNSMYQTPIINEICKNVTDYA
jgi:hypothetical protein